ncbi:MAG: deoxynucleoside kinase [Terriglobia bacterium]
MTAAPPLHQPLRFVAIEGPLRVGKTTLADLVADRLGAARLRDVEDNPFLGRFYQGDAGAAFQTQLYFLWQRFKQWQSLDFTGTANRIIVSDYLFAKDKIFAYLNLEDEELQLYEGYYGLLAEQAPIPDLVIYLQAKPETLRERIGRKREAVEKEISDEYIEAVIEAYDHFFFHYHETNLLVVETSGIDFVERGRDFEELLDRLSQPVKGTQYFLPLGSAPAD